ncbi:unnamed protein product [Schistosoma turkestanicum]|nr:unnamed protein product [Schistosoma turkestanicum]
MIRELSRISILQSLRNFRRSLSSRTHYDTLGINKRASKSEIHSAFIKLSKKYHPDKDGGDIETFKRINEAYSVLSQEKSRRLYDSSLISSTKPSYTNSPYEYNFENQERDFNIHLRCMRFGQSKRKTKINLSIVRSIFITTTLWAILAYFISLFTFNKKI